MDCSRSTLLTFKTPFLVASLVFGLSLALRTVGWVVLMWGKATVLPRWRWLGLTSPLTLGPLSQVLMTSAGGPRAPRLPTSGPSPSGPSQRGSGSCYWSACGCGWRPDCTTLGSHPRAAFGGWSPGSTAPAWARCWRACCAYQSRSASPGVSRHFTRTWPRSSRLSSSSWPPCASS